jgi:dTDP-4-amino-4,6-dideoxygalactose transaminase
LDWKITLADLDFGAEEADAVMEVLRSRWLTMGRVTEEFEKECAAAFGVKHVVCVMNGTAALELALRAIGVTHGEDVLLPSLTFVACANAVVSAGARPVVVEIESPEWPEISLADLRKKASPRTHVVMAVHYAGYPCRMKELGAFAAEAGITVMEDAAHAPLGMLEGRSLGAWGRVGCLSLFSNKNLAVGEGGLIVTDDDGVAEELRLLRSHGMTTLTWDRHRGHASEYDVVRAGYNARPSEITSALGRVQLSKLPRMNARRRELTGLYRRLLEGVKGVTVPFATAPAGMGAFVHTGHILPILLDGAIPRDAFRAALRDAGIQTSMHYPPIHLFSFYRNRYGFRDGDLPITEDYARREVTLPLHSRMSDDDVKTVVDAVAQAADA